MQRPWCLMWVFFFRPDRTIITTDASELEFFTSHANIVYMHANGGRTCQSCIMTIKSTQNSELKYCLKSGDRCEVNPGCAAVNQRGSGPNMLKCKILQGGAKSWSPFPMQWSVRAPAAVDVSTFTRHLTLHNQGTRVRFEWRNGAVWPWGSCVLLKRCLVLYSWEKKVDFNYYMLLEPCRMSSNLAWLRADTSFN